MLAKKIGPLHTCHPERSEGSPVSTHNSAGRRRSFASLRMTGGKHPRSFVNIHDRVHQPLIPFHARWIRSCMLTKYLLKCLCRDAIHRVHLGLSCAFTEVDAMNRVPTPPAPE